MSTFYHSTRSRNERVTSKKAILQGIAEDGGLFVTDDLADKHVDLATVCGQGYQENALLVLTRLLDDYTIPEISHCVDKAYGRTFDDPRVTPLTPIGDDWLLELHHGPTSAFKDVALQMLPQLMSLAQGADGEKIMIVCATSGDTGKAALAGFAGIDDIAVTVFYPDGKVSDIQRLQMVSQPGDNVCVCAIKGNFDDAQTEVKNIFADHGLAARLAEHTKVLSSANSINVGRLVPQVVYYFDAYAQLVAKGAVSIGDEVDFCVPTGNFGDVLAGYYAKMLGLPVRTFVVASNSNDVLVDFIRTGTYDRRRPFVKTISPSMDILVSSNLERLLFYLSGCDVELVSSLMRDLAEKGCYTIPTSMADKLRETFACGRANDDETRQAIRDAWDNHHVLIDPHTAVGMHVLSERPREGRARICLSTANPYKFPADVLRALGRGVDGRDGFRCMDELAELTGIAAPRNLSALRDASTRFSDVVEVSGMSAYVEQACARILP